MPAVEIRVPGDKSIAHRALILGALAEGESVIDEVPAGQDVRSTESCLQDLGVDIDHAGGMRRVQGAGPGAWRSPARPLDCQNSGTTMRLLTGVLAGSAITATLTGDASLRRRPMARVVDPLRAMGARIELRNGTPPLRVEGTPLSGGRHRLPVPSAQVKSALLLAGLLATGETVVEEPVQTRDHTERLLRAMGARLSATGTVVRVEALRGGLRPLRLAIPGDFSSAAFWFGAAAMRPGACVRVVDVGLNPSRTAFLWMLRAMGAEILIEAAAEGAVEPSGRVTVTGAPLRAIAIDGPQVAAAIDEIPILMVVATQAAGTTSITGAAELRVKESDRLRAMADGLRRMGAMVEEFPDGVHVEGPTRLRPALIDAVGDHRVAMALAIAGLSAESPTQIVGAESADVSYPGFFQELERVASAS
ncbi:MAG TPA: 3-phosphoshikimate 1-carboxyvinyltransferase [Candidatus Dormibacteraeota bacterium]|jgi:3-phosphoshikimate 1-carboxyvinyltransferase